MKKLILPLVCLFLASCSVEKDDLNEPSIHFSDLNAIVEIEGCEVESYDFGNSGKIEVTNDADTLYVTIAATAENFDLTNTKLHVANSETGFPTVGKGNLPPGKMEYNKDFDANIKSHTFKFPLASLEKCIYIASQSTFSNGEESVTTWAGDIDVKYGNWSYFQYCIQECVPACAEPEYTGPSVVRGSVNYTDAAKLGSNEEVRKLFAGLIPTEDVRDVRNFSLHDFSRYSPRISAIVTEFQTKLVEPFETYDLKTTFSYGSGECAGTIDLIITVIDNR